MGSDWQDTTVGDLLEEDGADIQTGPFGTKLKASEYSEEGVPVISVGEVRFGRLEVHDRTPFVPPSVTNRMPEYLLQSGDIVFGRKGAVERSGLVTPEQDGWFLGSDGIRIRLPLSCDPKFVSCHFLTRLHKNWMIQNAAGTTMPSLNESIVKRIPLRLPSLPIQKSIAYILGTLDDKIELNRRMNETLESMARALFKSWFVDFDPVIDNALAAGNPIPEPLIQPAQTRRDLGTHRKPLPTHIQKLFPNAFVFDEEMGWIPEGWAIRSVGDVTHRVTKGDTPRKAAMAAASEDETRVNMLRVNAITKHGEFLRDKFLEIPESIHLGKSKRSILKPNYILYTNAGTIGRVAFVRDDILPANTNQAIAIIQPDETKVPPMFLYMTVRQPEFQSELHFDIVEAVQANLALGKISEASFLMPSESVMNAVMQQLSEYLNRISANRRESATLTKLRDTLLPKLLSGELRIPDAEKLVAGSL